MHQAAAAYGKIAQATVSPRELEATLLLRAAMRLQMVKDDFEARKDKELDEALTFNRKLWAVFVNSMTAEDCPWPAPIRSNMINLANFVFNRTIDLIVGATPQKLDVLININRNIAAGLREQAAMLNKAADKPAA